LAWRDNIAVNSASRSCQVAVSLSLANHHASLPAASRLYLQNEWAADRKRRRKAGVREQIIFQTKPEIALEQIEAACKAGLPRGVVLMDAGLGLQHGSARQHQRAGTDLCGRHFAEHDSMGVRPGSAGTEKMVGPRPTANAASPRPQASTALGQGPGPAPAQACLAHHPLAGGDGRLAVIALRARSGSGCASRLQAHFLSVVFW
jgi:DDE superfamily endonuclease